MEECIRNKCYSRGAINWPVRNQGWFSVGAPDARVLEVAKPRACLLICERNVETDSYAQVLMKI